MLRWAVIDLRINQTQLIRPPVETAALPLTTVELTLPWVGSKRRISLVTDAKAIVKP
jgi:hypothetical protein